jgi:hypothetical protein
MHNFVLDDEHGCQITKLHNLMRALALVMSVASATCNHQPPFLLLVPQSGSLVVPLSFEYGRLKRFSVGERG